MDESDSLNDESDKFVSDSGSSCTYYFCAFSLRFKDYAGSVSVLVSDIFAPTGVESKGGIFAYNVFVLTGVKSKGGRLIKMFWHSNSLFYSQILNLALY